MVLPDYLAKACLEALKTQVLVLQQQVVFLAEKLEQERGNLLVQKQFVKLMEGKISK